MTRKLSMLACGIVVAGLIGCAIQFEAIQRMKFRKAENALAPPSTNMVHTNMPGTMQQSEGAR